MVPPESRGFSQEAFVTIINVNIALSSFAIAQNSVLGLVISVAQLWTYAHKRTP